MPHVGLIRLQVDGLTACLAYDLPKFQVSVKVLLNAANFGLAVPGRLQLVRDVSKCTHQRRRRLVQCNPLRLFGRQIVRNFGVATEAMDVLQFAPGRFHGFAEHRDGFPCVFQPFAALGQPVMQQNPRLRTSVTVIEFGGVDGDGFLDLLEQVLVVNNIVPVSVIMMSFW